MRFSSLWRNKHASARISKYILSTSFHFHLLAVVLCSCSNVCQQLFGRLNVWARGADRQATLQLCQLLSFTRTISTSTDRAFRATSCLAVARWETTKSIPFARLWKRTVGLLTALNRQRRRLTWSRCYFRARNVPLRAERREQLHAHSPSKMFLNAVQRKSPRLILAALLESVQNLPIRPELRRLVNYRPPLARNELFYGAGTSQIIVVLSVCGSAAGR